MVKKGVVEGSEAIGGPGGASISENYVRCVTEAVLGPIFDEADLAISGLDHRLVHAYANPKFRDLARGRDVVGKHLSKVFPGVGGRGFLSSLRTVIRTGLPKVIGSATALTGAPSKGRIITQGLHLPLISAADGSVEGVIMAVSQCHNPNPMVDPPDFKPLPRPAVFVIEDDPFQRMMMQIMLSDLFDNVLTFASGEEAAVARVQMLAGPDILITDQNLGNGPRGTDIVRFFRCLDPAMAVLLATSDDPRHIPDVGLVPEQIVSKPIGSSFPSLVMRLLDQGRLGAVC